MCVGGGGGIGGIIGGALSIVGGIQKNDAINKEFDYAQKEASVNTAYADEAATDARVRGGIAAGRTRMQGSQLIGQQETAYASGGVDASSGTPLQVMANTRGLTELDALTHENNAAREAWGYEKQAASTRRQLQLTNDRIGAERDANVLSTFGKFSSSVFGGAGGS